MKRPYYILLWQLQTLGKTEESFCSHCLISINTTNNNVFILVALVNCQFTVSHKISRMSLKKIGKSLLRNNKKISPNFKICKNILFSQAWQFKFRYSQLYVLHRRWHLDVTGIASAGKWTCHKPLSLNWTVVTVSKTHWVNGYVLENVSLLGIRWR